MQSKHVKLQGSCLDLESMENQFDNYEREDRDAEKHPGMPLSHRLNAFLAHGDVEPVLSW